MLTRQEIRTLPGAFVEATFANGERTVPVGGRCLYNTALLQFLEPEVVSNYRYDQRHIEF